MVEGLNGISMEYAQGLFLNYGPTLKCHFYDLIVFKPLNMSTYGVNVSPRLEFVYI